MSVKPPDSSLCQAEGLCQFAIVAGHESEPIPFSPMAFAVRARRYLERLVLGSASHDILIDSSFDRDSVVQFVAACQGCDFELTASNVFEIELLCDHWSVSCELIRKRVADFIEHPPSGESLRLRQLLFRLSRNLDVSKTEEFLRENLVSFVDNSAAFEIPVAVLVRSVDFRAFERRTEDYERLFTFCLEYLAVHGSAASHILRTLDVTRLSSDSLDRLCAADQFNWGVLNESLCRLVIGLRNDFAQEHEQKEALTAENAGQEKRLIQLENETNDQEWEIQEHRLEIKSLKEAKTKLEVDLKCRNEAHDALKRELQQLKMMMNRLGIQ
jgi:hypothetical protein